MKISWNWLSELVDLSSVSGPEELGEILTRRGLEVEEIHRQGAGLEKVVTVQILEKAPHPQADRLSLCKVTTGEGEPLDIVCGAQNMKAGDRVALAQIGANLPNGLKIKKSEIRGAVSNGMLCSEEELKLKEKSEGILILPQDTPLGRPLAEILGLNDAVFTFKLTANRGDCLSHYGMAREIAAALSVKTGKDLQAKRPSAKEIPAGKSPVSLHLDAGDQAPQFWGAYIDGVKVGPSPAWAVKKLESVGLRTINNVVDATNLVMLELGQPVHAYDADRIEAGAEGPELRVRVAKEGEELPLLDGSSVKLAGTELVIADGKRAVGLAGVMGGGNSEVQDGTTRVFLECAEFDPVLVRRAAARHVKRTDAAHRFERGVDPAGQAYALARLATLVQELAGGQIKGSTQALRPSREKVARKPVAVKVSYFENFLGMAVDIAQAESILRGLECKVEKTGAGSASEEWKVTPPTYRSDLNLPQDIAEEIARSVGYDQIRETLPALTNSPRSIWENAALPVIDRAKNALVEAGLSEALNYGFSSKAWLAKFKMSSNALVMNPISEEHEAMVPSLLPGLIHNALDNWNHHFGSEPLAIRLFEIRPTFHSKGEIRATSEMDTGVEEKWKLALVLSGPRYASGLRNERGEVDFYDVKGVVENLLQSLGTKGVRFHPMAESRSGGNPLFHPGQSAEILAGNTVAGAFGLLHPALSKDLKTRAPLWIMELDWAAIAKLSRNAVQSPTYKAIPSFPPMERDFALVVKSDISADKITQIALKAGKPLAKVAKVFDIYRGSQVAEGMTSVAVRVIFYEEGRSLQEAETEAASAQILAAWKKDLGAELR